MIEEGAYKMSEMVIKESVKFFLLVALLVIVGFLCIAIGETASVASDVSEKQVWMTPVDPWSSGVVCTYYLRDNTGRPIRCLKTYYQHGTTWQTHPTSTPTPKTKPTPVRDR